MSYPDALIPPQEMIFVGDGDFKAIGEHFLNLFIEFGGLQPNDTVLDVGCGIGRIALPLVGYLNCQARYEGFDIVSSGVNWCREKITVRYPNFRFRLVDIYNRHYNSRGRYKASEYVFPYEDETFDFIVLSSIFTHLLPEDMENYLLQIARVLKKGGTCFITAFLMNDETSTLLSEGKSRMTFDHHIDNYWVEYMDNPEAAIAFDQSIVFDLYKKYKLEIKQPILYGSWCGRTNSVSWQDIIVASKSS